MLEISNLVKTCKRSSLKNVEKKAPIMTVRELKQRFLVL